MEHALNTPTSVPRSLTRNASDRLLRDGYMVLENLVPPSLVSALNRDLDRSFTTTPFCEGAFYGERTKRFGSLLRRSRQSSELIRHPIILEIAEAVLGAWCDTIQLNLGQAIEIFPGALSQFPHRDQDMWRGPVGEIEYLINVMWPLTDFTKENGATLFWPGSHGERALQEAPEEEPVAAECLPGSAIIFLGSTLHAAGSNLTNNPRRGVVVSYCLGWLKPYENQWLVYPPEVARDFDPDIAALVGYRQHRPNLGNYEGQCPSILLSDAPPIQPNAVDALRPDQAEAVEAFAAEQRLTRHAS